MTSSAGPAANSQDSGRTAHFNSGMTGSGNVATSLNPPKNSDAYTSLGFHPTSVLDATQISGFHPSDANSAADTARQTPSGQIPGPNGSAQSTYSALTPSYQTRLAV
jgi:hypothetical protein